ncbi:MAG TPA: MurR/RpiR family transcriptional regulator, partial [Victivallales bacterium]|nr:MurR/RpiR family transcriptional regulator [Victivallales bacterium]
VAAIENTVSMVNINYIEKASDKILKSDRVEIYGVGASAFTAGDLMYKLIRLGINASTYGDNHLQLMSAATLDNKSTALGISYSGGTIDTVSSLRTAKKKRSIHNCDNQLYQISDYRICRYSTSDFSI